MLAPLCALALFGVVLLRDSSWGNLISGPAVILATSTIVPAQTEAAPAVAQPIATEPASPTVLAPTASPSALVSDAVSAAPTATAPVPTSAPPAATLAAPTATPLVPPTTTTVPNATEVPASPTPFGAATETAPAPTATATPGTAPTATAGPEGWAFQGLNAIKTPLNNAQPGLTLLAELVNTSSQDQMITAIQATIKFTDGNTREVGGDDVYWPTRDAEFESGLAPNGKMPIEVTLDGVGEGVEVAEVSWRVQAAAGGAIGRKDLQAQLITTSDRNGWYCAYYKLTIPPPEINQAVVVGFWAYNESGGIIGFNTDFPSTMSGQKPPLCIPILDGEVVHTTGLAVWGQ